MREESREQRAESREKEKTKKSEERAQTWATAEAASRSEWGGRSEAESDMNCANPPDTNPATRQQLQTERRKRETGFGVINKQFTESQDGVFRSGAWRRGGDRGEEDDRCSLACWRGGRGRKGGG
eukprot:169983-Rhodomonas_salina.1